MFNFLGTINTKSAVETENPIAIDAASGKTAAVAEKDDKKLPDIPEHVFVEYAKPKLKTIMETQDVSPEINNIQTLYRYLETNLESKGYDDALVNPDSSVMEEHVQFINNELNFLISKVKTYYTAYLKTIDFHIETRKRNGMIETVEELVTYKETILDEIKVVASIEKDASEGKGLSQNLTLSYKKGFRNGFAAITYNTVLGRKN
jgi:hypothetical protein